MSDHELPGSSGPESAGAEAGPLLPAGTEAPAWVGELLASLRADDPPLPDDVAERIDRALALLTPGDVLPAEADPARPVESLSPQAPEDAGSDRPGATVLPIAARDRRDGSPSPWGHRLLLGGVAAAAALLLGGLGTVAVVRNSGNSGDAPRMTAGSGASGDENARVRYVASQQDYTAATLDTTAQAVLAASTTPLTEGTPSPAPSADPTPTTPSSTSTPASPSPGSIVLRVAADRPAGSCVDSLAGADGVAPLVVDEATYDKRPAFVVVIATPGDAGTADVWVVARTCTAGNEGVLAFARITR